MAKRFTDTNKWDKAWYMALPIKGKLLWNYLCDKCDHAGIWEKNLNLASFHLGEKVSDTDLERYGIRLIPVDHDKVFLPGFISFQYGALNDSNRVHRSVLAALQKYGIDPISLAPSKPLVSPIQGAKDKDKDMDKEKDKEKGGVGENKTRAQQFVDAWNENCGELPRVEKLTPKREEKIKARLKDDPDIEYWKKVFRRMAQSPFCLGKTGGTWRADFDFALQPDSHVKVMEGKYDPRKIDPDQNVLQIDADKKRQLAEAQAELDAYAKTLRKL